MALNSTKLRIEDMIGENTIFIKQTLVLCVDGIKDRGTTYTNMKLNGMKVTRPADRLPCLMIFGYEMCMHSAIVFQIITSFYLKRYLLSYFLILSTGYKLKMSQIRTNSRTRKCKQPFRFTKKHRQIPQRDRRQVQQLPQKV